MNKRPVDDAPAGLPRNYLRPCLLLVLAEGTAHGYELIAQLPALGLPDSDPGGVYRCLRAMDEDGLISSKWEPSAVGPARRRYELTAEGAEWLHLWAGTLAEVHRVVGGYLARYVTHTTAERAAPVREQA